MRAALLVSGFLAGVVLLARPASLAAQGSSHADLSVGARISTLGYGLEVNKWLVPHLGVRAGINYFKHTGTETDNDIEYKISAKLKAFTALVDFFPSARGSFHLTGGLMTNPASLSATGQPSGSGTYDINGTTYTSAEVGTLTGSIEFPSVAPYLGLGWGTAARGGPLAFLFDLGAGIGTPTIKLSATGAASNPTLANDLKAEEAKVRDDVNKYVKVYPVLSLGLAYRF